MSPRNTLKTVAAACLTLGVAFAMSNAGAQQPSEIEAVKAATQAFYAVLSARDIDAMRKVWASEGNRFNIGPRAQTASVGADALGSFVATFARYSDSKITFEQTQLGINGPAAWVTGIERSQQTLKNGEVQTGTNLGTNIFVNQGGRWLMVGHHASAMPK
jgi:ketosteroid isomerase-like protein